MMYTQLNPKASFMSASPNPVNVGSSWTEVLSATIPAGTWLVVYGASFATNSSGYRSLYNSYDSTGRKSPSVAAASGEQTRMNATTVVTYSAPTVFKVYARQNSGSTLECYPYYYAISIP